MVLYSIWNAQSCSLLFDLLSKSPPFLFLRTELDPVSAIIMFTFQGILQRRTLKPISSKRNTQQVGFCKDSSK